MRGIEFSLLLALVLSAAIFNSPVLYIGDEMSYLNRGFAFAQGLKEPVILDFFSGIPFKLIPFDYPLGTALFLALGITLGGIKTAFLMNVIALGLSFYLTTRTLNKLGKANASALIFFWYPAALLMSRMLMSDVLSLLWVSAFYAIYFSEYKARTKAFWLAFLAAFSIWFRETNLLLFLLPLGFLLYESPRLLWSVLAGGISGVLPRLLSGYWVYGDVFFLKNPHIEFNLSNLPFNFLVYGLYIILFFPFAFWVLLRVESPQQRILSGSFGLFLLLYLCYGYTGLKESGLKGIFLSSRFLIPLLPIYVYSFAWDSPRFLEWEMFRWLSRVLPFATLIWIMVFNILYWQMGRAAINFRSFVEQEIKEKDLVLVLDPYNEIIEVVDPLILSRMNNLKLSTPEALSTLKQPTEKLLYIKVSRNENAYQKRKYNNLRQKERLLLKNYQLKKIKTEAGFFQKMEAFYLVYQKP